MMHDSEESLVDRAGCGDVAAFEELVRRTSRLIFARLVLETGDAHLAEDLLQETFLTAYRSLHLLAEPAKFRAWLLRIAQNQAIDAIRKAHRHKRQADPEEDKQRLRLVGGPRPDEDAERKELRQHVLAMLRSLPEEYRSALSLRYLAGADYETIQMQLGISNGALRGLLHRGLKLLRAEMSKLLGENIGVTRGKATI